MTKLKIKNKSKCQIPNVKTSVLGFVILILNLFCALNFVICHYLFAQETNLEQNVTQYLEGHQYNECVDYLKNLSAENKELAGQADYYIALSRYRQLKYLEEKQEWNEYFNNGNLYRGQLQESLDKAVAAATPENPLNPQAKLLLWQYYKEQDSDLAENALTSLVESVVRYTEGSGGIGLIKGAADTLLSYQEKAKAKELYRIYVDKLSGTDIGDAELKSIAEDFYRKENLDLAEAVYDIYAKRAGKDNIDEGLLYLKAFSLQTAKEYAPAKDIYFDLISRFPESPHALEAAFKIGAIYAYALRDLNSGKNYFEAAGALTQLQILKQWQDEPASLERGLRAFLDASLKEENAVFDMSRVSIEVSIHRVKIGQPVKVTASTYNLQAGCMQVEVEYLWSGDLGTAKLPVIGNTFETSYDQSGTKLICVVAVSPTGIIDRGIEMVDVE